MSRVIRRIFLATIPFLGSPRVPLYGAIPLFFYGCWTQLHMPQGYDDYVTRLITLPTALLFCVVAMLHKRQLAAAEVTLCGVLLLLLTAVVPLSVWDAMSVRAFCDR